MASNSQFTIDLQLNLEVFLDHEIEEYVSSCPSLDIHSQGGTEQEAIDGIHEAVAMFLRNCYERGVLNQVLQECGFVANHPIHSQRHTLQLEQQGEVRGAKSQPALV